MSVGTSEIKDFVVFDYDGTVAPEGGGVIPAVDSVHAGVEALWLAGVTTTTITARPYQRLTLACGGAEGLNRLVSAHCSLATERGGRIVSPDRKANVGYQPLDSDELDAITDIDNPDDVDFIGFYPKELHGTSFIWGGNADRQDELSARFGHDTVVLPSGRLALRKALQTAEPCLVKIRFSTPNPDKAVLQDDLNAVWDRRTAEVVAGGVDKRSALEALCGITGAVLESVRYAGNDTSDLPILQIAALRERIFVGNNEVNGMAEPVTRLASPEALGEYLMQIARPAYE